MLAAQRSFASKAHLSAMSLPDEFGEQVLVTSRRAGALEDGHVLASHATFGWRTAIKVVTQRDGTRLHFETHRPTAGFARTQVPPGLRAGDRITRSWDHASFEVLSVYWDRGRLQCDLVEVGGRVH